GRGGGNQRALMPIFWWGTSIMTNFLTAKNGSHTTWPSKPCTRKLLKPPAFARGDRPIAGTRGFPPPRAREAPPRHGKAGVMAEGIRLLSVKRGVDPREFALLAFGGAAGLHVSRVARHLQIQKVLIPTAAPVFSAYGMLNTDLQYAFSHSYTASLEHVDLGAVY